MKVGIFGGTFDPPHLAHLQVARAARDRLHLGLLEVIPCAVPPHRGEPRADGWDRFAMVAMTFAGEERVLPSARELRRGGVSYTVDTLEEIAAERPGDEIYLVLGADSYDDLPWWKNAGRILELAHLAVAARPGSFGLERLRPEDRERLRPPGDPPPPGRRGIYRIPMDPVPIAARRIRDRIARGDLPREDLHPAVQRYILARGLYGPAGPEGGHG